jgi:hypothetical protein
LFVLLLSAAREKVLNPSFITKCGYVSRCGIVEMKRFTNNVTMPRLEGMTENSKTSVRGSFQGRFYDFHLSPMDKCYACCVAQYSTIERNQEKQLPDALSRLARVG